MLSSRDENRKLLLDFLDSRIFNPILEALPEQYSTEWEQHMLKKVKEVTLLETEMFHRSGVTAREIKEMFFHELHNEISSNIGKGREDLELPRFIEIRDQFLCLCKDVVL